MTHEMTKRNNGNQTQLETASERPTIRPPVDVYENKDEYLLVADMPGVSTDDLRIDIHAGRLTIEGNMGNGSQGTSMEREWGVASYRRSFDIPDTIDTAKVSAELKKGVLWLHLPKQESVKPRQIQVRAG